MRPLIRAKLIAYLLHQPENDFTNHDAKDFECSVVTLSLLHPKQFHEHTYENHLQQNTNMRNNKAKELDQVLSFGVHLYEFSEMKIISHLWQDTILILEGMI